MGKPKKADTFFRRMPPDRNAWKKEATPEEAVKAYFYRFDPTSKKTHADKAWDLTYALLEFADNPDGHSLAQFCAQERIPPRSFERYCNKYPYLDAARQMAKTNIAARLYILARDNPAYTNYATKVLPTYDPDYLQMLKDLIEAKKQANNKEVDQKVVVELVDYSKNTPTRKATEDRE